MYLGCRMSGRDRSSAMLLLTNMLKPFSLYAESSWSSSVRGYGFPCSPFPAKKKYICLKLTAKNGLQRQK